MGIRDLDAGERDFLKKSGVTCYTMRDLDERGMRDVLDEAIRLASDGTARDPPVVRPRRRGPEDAPGTGTPVWGGISYREAHLAMEMSHDRANIVAHGPGRGEPGARHQNMTGTLAAGAGAERAGEDDPVAARALSGRARSAGCSAP
jgi:arginase